MKKIFSLFIFAVAAGFSLAAQETPSRPFNISIQGGGLFSINENSFSYSDNGKTMNLFTSQGAIAFGYDFSQRFGIRISVSHGKNASACNVLQTSARGFYPYSFSSVNYFADAMLDLGKEISRFSPKLYIGIGGANTYNFTDSGHPWQKVSKNNAAFGFRGGFIAQYDFSDYFGIYADLCGEAYTDRYNGLIPTRDD